MKAELILPKPLEGNSPFSMTYPWKISSYNKILYGKWTDASRIFCSQNSSQRFMSSGFNLIGRYFKIDAELNWKLIVSGEMHIQVLMDHETNKHYGKIDDFQE